MDERPKRQRRIGHAPGDDDVRALRQRIDNALRAEVRIGRHHTCLQRCHWRAAIHQREVVAAGLQQIEHIVARHGRHAQLEPQLAGDVECAFGRRLRVGRAHVRDDADAARRAGRQYCPHARFEQRVVAMRRVFAAHLLCERDGALGQAFEHQHVDVAVLCQFQRRFDAVA